MDAISYSKIAKLLQQWIKNFSWISISPAKDEWFGFFGQDLTNVDFSNSTIIDPKFTSSILMETIFSNATFYIQEKDIEKIFKDIKIIKDVDFRGAQFELYSDNDFSMTYPLKIEELLTAEQYGNVIKTDKEYKKFLERKNQEQKTQLESTTKKQTESLLEWFENLVKEYYFEEKFWIRIVSLIAFFLMYIVFLPILLQFYKTIYIILIPASFFFILYTYLVQQLQKKPKQTLYKFEEKLESFLDSCYDYWVFILSTGLISFFAFGIIPKMPLESINFSFSQYYFISPIIILFVTLLYFSVIQYSKSKKLRIDNQNKIALIHGMMAIKADTTNMDKEKFYDKIADIAFDRVHHEKEENLPLDKIIQLIKAINPKDSQK